MVDLLPFSQFFFSKKGSNEVNLTSQCSHLEVLLVSRFWSERGDFNFVDNDPKDYELSCCGSLVQIAAFGQIWAEIKCIVHVALPQKPLKQFKLV